MDSSPVLVEEFITGTPVTVGLLELPGGVVAFPPVATYVHETEFYDADTKLDIGSQGTVSVEPAEFPAHVQDLVTRYACILWEPLDCRGAIRVDFMVTSAGAAYALEINPTPGMSREANFITGAGLVGLSHTDVVRAYLHEALTRPAYDVPLPVPAGFNWSSRGFLRAVPTEKSASGEVGAPLPSFIRTCELSAVTGRFCEYGQ
ncbi:hypothetical protein GCM10010317_046860 [Streptomyces mirabilis]|uniref:hypothetical protein n=1 Tax=Streptomyces mirabilis TaxID=68239 RepID=UPI00167DF079|nr:hypothetical protein [Streptomyces mirabilis]GHD58124.1 hypothetical protein GCM10010317_046860 [Streptomyces mirabilis]